MIAVIGIILALGLSSGGTIILDHCEPRGSLLREAEGIDGAGKPRRNPGGELVTLGLQGGIWVGAVLVMYVGVYRPLEANWSARLAQRVIRDDLDKAIGYFERAVTLDPTKELYWIELGGASQMRARRTGDRAEQSRWLTRARGAFEEAVRLVPSNSYNHANLGRLLGELAGEGLANPADAFAAVEQALQLDDRNAYFYADAANMALMLGDYARAKGYASRGTAVYPSFGPTRAQLGVVALAEKRFEEAVHLLQEALDGDWHEDKRGRVSAGSNLALALLEAGRFQEAHYVARQVVDQAPDSPSARFNLAKALEMLGRRAEAIREYERLLPQDREHELAREALRRLGVPRPDGCHADPRVPHR